MFVGVKCYNTGKSQNKIFRIFRLIGFSLSGTSDGCQSLFGCCLLFQEKQESEYAEYTFCAGESQNISDNLPVFPQ
jgi:hypothetical protein